MEKKGAKGLFAEFKEFISKGSVMDLAVGVIVGGAFTAIVNSLVKDMIMPLVGVIIGGIDFNSLSVTLKAATEEKEAVILQYGSFLQNVVNFLLTALVVFLLVKGLNAFKRKKEEEPAPAPAPAEPSEDILLLREIRDSLKK